LGGRPRPIEQRSAEELAKRALLGQGLAAAVNMRRHGNLIAWAKERGLFVRVNRATAWGNPFVLGGAATAPLSSPGAATTT